MPVRDIMTRDVQLLSPRGNLQSTARRMRDDNLNPRAINGVAGRPLPEEARVRSREHHRKMMEEWSRRPKVDGAASHGSASSRSQDASHIDGSVRYRLKVLEPWQQPQPPNSLGALVGRHVPNWMEISIEGRSDSPWATWLLRMESVVGSRRVSTLAE